MVNGISSSQSSMGYYLQNQGMRTGPGPADMFKKVDTDGSGGVSQSELDTLATKLSSMTGSTIDTSEAISTYDTDGNGELSDDELKSFMQATMPAPMSMQGPPDLFSDSDSDGSGGISETELETLASNISSATGQTLDTTDAISTYDTDGDGELSDDELKSFLDASGVTPPPPPGMGAMGMQGPPDLFSDSDADGSGGISETELETLASNISSATGQTLDTTDAISTYDTDGDGELSDDELKSFLDASGITPPPPPSVGMNGASGEETTSSADSIISTYDTNGDGVLSSSELQAYLDNTSQSTAQQGLAAYLQMDRASDSFFMNTASYGGGQRSVDYLA